MKKIKIILYILCFILIVSNIFGLQENPTLKSYVDETPATQTGTGFRVNTDYSGVNPQNHRGYMKFDFSSIGNVSNNATLYMSANDYDSSSLLVRFRFCEDGIYSGLNWNNQDTEVLKSSCTSLSTFTSGQLGTGGNMAVISDFGEYINNDTDKLFTIYARFDNEDNGVPIKVTWFVADPYIEYTNLSLCSPDWNCSSFEDCNINNVSSCLSVEDLNLCNETFTGNLSNYNDVCSYVTPTEPTPSDYSITVDYDNTNRYIFYIFALWLGLLFISSITKDEISSGYLFILTGITGIFSALWLYNNIENFPKLVTSIFMLINAFIIFMSFEFNKFK